MMTNVYLSKIPGKRSGKEIYDNMRSIQVKVVHIIVIFRGRGVSISVYVLYQRTMSDEMERKRCC